MLNCYVYNIYVCVCVDMCTDLMKSYASLSINSDYYSMIYKEYQGEGHRYDRHHLDFCFKT